MCDENIVPSSNSVELKSVSLVSFVPIGCKYIIVSRFAQLVMLPGKCLCPSLQFLRVMDFDLYIFRWYFCNSYKVFWKRIWIVNCNTSGSLSFKCWYFSAINFVAVKM